MEKEYPVIAVDEPDWETIGGGIHNFNIQQAGENHHQRLCYVIQGPEEEVLGGVIAEVYWNWLYIDLMFVKEDYRGQGYGRRLLNTIENKARELGARNVFLDTFSFQAPEFYKKYGYQVFGELEGFPDGHQRYYLTKTL